MNVDKLFKCPSCGKDLTYLEVEDGDGNCENCKNIENWEPSILT